MLSFVVRAYTTRDLSTDNDTFTRSQSNETARLLGCGACTSQPRRQKLAQWVQSEDASHLKHHLINFVHLDQRVDDELILQSQHKYEIQRVNRNHARTQALNCQHPPSCTFTQETSHLRNSLMNVHLGGFRLHPIALLEGCHECACGASDSFLLLILKALQHDVDHVLLGFASPVGFRFAHLHCALSRVTAERWNKGSLPRTALASSSFSSKNSSKFFLCAHTTSHLVTGLPGRAHIYRGIWRATRTWRRTPRRSPARNAPARRAASSACPQYRPS